MARRKFKWTQHQIDKLNKVKTVLEELVDYMPLTLRQIYYQLVGKGYIENSVAQYNMLSKLLKHARLDGYVDWDHIEDRVRAYHDLTGWEDADSFVDASVHHFLKGYQRDLLQTQDKYLELWIEKDALSSVFTKVATPYTVPVVVCRGFSSISFLHEFKVRLEALDGRNPVMLYFGDFDPSGMEMLDSMKITIRNEMGVDNIQFKRIALLKEDIEKYKLPHNPNALKKSDTRANKHVERYGELAVELDALRPDILEGKIKDAILAEIDMGLYEEELRKYEADMERLSGLKRDVEEYVANY